jgi:Fe(3+) dicitrate transport protein
MIDKQFILDLSGNYIISNNMSLFASVTNLTNNVNIVARRPAGLRPGMPRAVKLGIKASF